MANQLQVKHGLVVSGSLQATGGVTGSLKGTAATASYVLQAVSASFATTAATFGGNTAGAFATTGSNTFSGNQIFNGNVTVNGTGSFLYLNTTYESASIIYSSGSNQIGDDTGDVQTLVGIVKISGSLQVTGSANIPSITGSLSGNASSATTATNASNVVVTDDPAGGSTYYVTFVSNTSGNQSITVDSSALKYVPSTNTLTVDNVTGTAATASYVAGASVNGAVSDSTNLNGQAASYYLNASNINNGTLSNSYLPSAINVTSVTASFKGNLTGTASYASLAATASYYGGSITSASYAGTASYVNTLNQAVTINGAVNSTGNVSGSSIEASSYVQAGLYSRTFSGYASINPGTTAIISLDPGVYSHRAIFMKYTLFDNNAPSTNARAGNIVVVSTLKDGGASANITETTTQDIGDTSLIDFDVVVSGTNDIRMINGAATKHNIYFEYTLL